jgi:nitroreductase
MQVIPMDVLEAIHSRTMVREYLDKPVGEKEKEAILNAAIRAPTAAGSEQWYFLVVESEKKREELYRLLIEAQKAYYSKMQKAPLPDEKIEKWVTAAKKGAYKAPFYVAVFVDMRQTFCTIPYIEELWAQQSVAGAIENMLLAAWGIGIGGCWFGVPLLQEDEFYSALGMVKDGLKLAAILGFGYPKGETSPRRRKKSLQDVVRVV